MGSALERAQERVGGALSSPLRVTPFRDMRRRQGGKYLIKHVIPGGSLVLVYGISGSGKTFFVGYAALCIAADREFLGQRVKGGLVVYVAPENPRSVEERFAAFGTELGIEDAELVMIAGDLDLLNPATFVDLLVELRRIVATNGIIAAVVIDTVSQAMPGADENGSDGMTAFVQACQRIRLEFDCSVIAVHHAGKDSERGARGHSSLRAAVDVEIKITSQQGQRLAELTKSRDGADGLAIPFVLRPITIGVDEDGESITTCIVESSLATPEAISRARPTGANQKLVLQALERCVSLSGRTPPGKPLSRIRAVTLDTLRTAASDDEFNQFDAKHRSSRINDAISGLKAGNFINWQDEWIWVQHRGSAPPEPLLHRGFGAGGAMETPENPRIGDFGAIRGES